MCGFEQLIFLKYVKSNDFSQNQYKIGILLQCPKFLWSEISQNFYRAILFIICFLCVYFAGFLLSTPLHLSLFQAPKLPFFFFFFQLRWAFFQPRRIFPKSFSSANLCHDSEKNITQKNPSRAFPSYIGSKWSQLLK